MMRSPLVALGAMLMLGYASCGSGINESWRLPLGVYEVGQENYLPVAVMGNTIVAASGGGTAIHGIQGDTGDLIWTRTGGASLELIKTDASLPDVVFLHFEGGVFEGWNITTGDRIWSWTGPNNTVLTDFSFVSQSVIFFNDYNASTPIHKNRLRGNLIRLNSTTGDLLYSKPVSSKYADSSYWLTATNEVVSLGFTMGELLTYDTATGDNKCSFIGAPNTLYFPPGTFAGRYGLLYVDDDNKIYDLLTCAAVTGKFPQGDIAAAVGDQFFMFHTDYNFLNRTGELSFQAALYDVILAATKWNVSLPFPGNNGGGSPLFAAALPFSPGAAYFLANGRFSVYNASNGAPLWKINTFVPFAKTDLSKHLVFPLGPLIGGCTPSIVFIPNLMGYVVYDVTTQTVMHHVETLPIAGTVGLSSDNGRYFAVFAEVESGDLVAVVQGV